MNMHYSSSMRLVLGTAVAVLLIGCSALNPDGPAVAVPRDRPLAPLPEQVTSFGAVTVGDWVYVFGGHTGERHAYSVEKVSGAFHRLNLNGGGRWEVLPSSLPGQGQPLVAHGRHIYRIGGMAARNPASGKQDLVSLDVVERFDTRSHRWERLPALPEPRSSHDAVVVGDRVYVAGGWRLDGGTNKPAWPTTGLMLDLRDLKRGWQAFPQPFQRRALALATVGGKVFCIGGMDSDNQPTLSVDVHDTATGKWLKGPSLPPGRFKGFGCSAIAQGGRVYANLFQGDLLRLAPDGEGWEVVGRLSHPRMAHRLVTAGAARLIALGGEDGENKRPDLELLTPQETGRGASLTPATAVSSRR